MLKNEKIYLHAFGLIRQIGSIRLQKLKKYFNSLELAWQANYNDLKRAGLTQGTIKEFIAQRKYIIPEKEFKKIDKRIKLITIADHEYPKLLKEIHDPPQLLYCRGNIKLLKEKSLAVVGSRAMTEYGQRVCEELISQIRLVIVSGLAIGIDTCAHQTAFPNTIAVLGSGLNNDCIFPAENRKLAQKIINKGGLILSEYAPHLMARREFFPMRNRIISGLSLGTLVIEAAEKSGALITAYQALEQNRSVMAIPGQIYQNKSVGTNNLIKAGAKLVSTGQDILDELNLNNEFNNLFNKTTDHLKQNNTLSVEENLILQNLNLEPTELDKIIKSTRLNASQVFSSLTILELKGLVKNLGNNKFTLCRKN